MTVQDCLCVFESKTVREGESERVGGGVYFTSDCKLYDHQGSRARTHTPARPFTNRVSASAPIVVTEPVTILFVSAQDSPKTTHRGSNT